MILRRIAIELRDQNWVTVIIELLVVVVGIFLGLQADAWNEARNDRQKEQFHLGQLMTDAELNASELGDLAAHHARLAEGLTFAIGALKRGQLKPDETERFKSAVLTMFQYPPALINTGAYDALLQSGDFSTIRDPDLRLKLVSLNSFFEKVPERIDKLTDGLSASDILSDDLAYAIPHPSGRGIEWQVDFEGLRDHPGALGFLSTNRRNHSIVSDVYAYGQRESEELGKYIAEASGAQE
jgi:hypothetical protein